MQQPPPSVSNNTINVTGVAAGAIAFFICRYLHADTLTIAFALCITYAATILSLETVFLKTYKRPSTGLDWSKRDYNVKRVAIKYLGLCGTLAVIGIIYYLSPDYHDFYYLRFWQALRIALPVFLVLAIPYFAFVDARMQSPEDGYYAAGLCFLGRWNETEYNVVMQHTLAWLVKGFFLPLMWVGLVSNFDRFSQVSLHALLNFSVFFPAVFFGIFTLDVLIAIVGYALSMRIFDNHTRTTDSTFFGWFVCIICYVPIFFVLQNVYDVAHQSWMTWLVDYPMLKVLWGSSILCLLCAYVAATVNFGCRFSNLTYRGIITNGMYRFTKHPAYVFKNVAWWMMDVPFIPSFGWREAVSYSLFLLAVNGMYLLRARTEEQLLSRDPDYVAYALWMNEHGIFRGVSRMLPWLRFQIPR